MPAPENGVPAIADPELVSPLTVPLPAFATQTFPEPSIAMLDGKLKPPALKLVAETPSGAILVTLPVRFATHALPRRRVLSPTDWKASR